MLSGQRVDADDHSLPAQGKELGRRRPGYLALADQNFAPNLEIHPTADTPPTFILQAEDDPVHAENAVVYFLALENANVPAELHIYAHGGTGTARAPVTFPSWTGQSLWQRGCTRSRCCRRSRAYNRLMRFAVLTISDRCSEGLQTDTAGPAAVAVLRREWPEAEIQTGLLRDDEPAIATALEELARQGAALVLTVGGTGLGPRDRTPEATRRVIDREAPGLAEAMRAIGAERNHFAWLSRGVAGLRGGTLIVNLPGSRRGAEESLESILHLLHHGLEVVGGSQDHPS